MSFCGVKNGFGHYCGNWILGAVFQPRAHLSFLSFLAAGKPLPQRKSDMTTRIISLGAGGRI